MASGLRPRAAAVALLAALAAACDAPSRVTAPDGGAARAASPGFDIAVWPGDAAMRAWAPPASPYRWVGYYLVAPCHRDASFSGRRAAVAALGLGTAVLYVGQQTWEGVPARLPADTGTLAPLAAPSRDVPARAARVTASVTCSRTLLSAAQGAAEGADAVARAAAEGFPRGTAIYLDLEPMTTIPEAMRDYYRAWVRALLADGRYVPAIYCHWRNADAIRADVQPLATAAGQGAMRFWIARSAGFSLDRVPTDAGFAFAYAWQGALDVSRTWNGRTLVIDENVAATASPSAP